MPLCVSCPQGWLWPDLCAFCSSLDFHDASLRDVLSSFELRITGVSASVYLRISLLLAAIFILELLLLLLLFERRVLDCVSGDRMSMKCLWSWMKEVWCDMNMDDGGETEAWNNEG